MAASASAGAPFEVSVGEVVHHGGTPGIADRVLFSGREAVDAGPDVDALRASGDETHHGLRGREVGVPGEGVVLAEPCVLSVVLVCGDGIGDFALEREMLGVGVS